MKQFSEKPWYFLALSVGSGLLLSVGWYFPFNLALFFALAPLLAIEEAIEARKLRRPYLTFWGYSLLALLIWNVGDIWWLWNASGYMTLAAWGMNALLQSLPLVLSQLVSRASNRKFGYLPFICLWLSFEYLHLNWGFSWPWLNLGNAFGAVPSWVQWYDFTGALGGSLWVLVANALAYHAIFKQELRVRWALSIIAPIAYSLVVGYQYKIKGETAEVVVVQPNYDCYSEKFAYNAKTGEPNGSSQVPYRRQLQEMIELSEANITDTTAFVLWPETAMHQGIEEDKANAYFDVAQVQEMVNRHPKAALVSGADSHIFYADPSQHTKTTRHYEGYGYYDKFGSALFVSRAQAPRFYHKSKLVIGAETVPFYSLLKPILLNFGGTSGGLGVQAQRMSFKHHESKASAGPVICYESVYGEFMTDYVRAGANFIAVITNDGWWGNTPGHRQHLAFSSLRAIELRRDIARSANTGISCFINQKGEITSQLPYDQKGALRGTVRLNTETTVYAQWGDYLGRLAAFLSVFMLISGLVRRRVLGGAQK